MLLDDLAEFEIFWSGITCFIQRGIVIVAGRLWRIWIIPAHIGAIHKASGGAAMKHIQVNGYTIGQNGIQFAGVFFQVAGIVAAPPAIKPAGIPFGYIIGPFTIMVFIDQRFYFLRIIKSVYSRQIAGEITCGQLRWSVASKQGAVKSCFAE